MKPRLVALLSLVGLLMATAGLPAGAQEAPTAAPEGEAQAAPSPPATQVPAAAAEGERQQVVQAAAVQAAVDPSVTIRGAGATFPANMIEQWKADVKRSLNLTVEYQGVGSGGGRSQFIAGTVDFGATDVPMNASETTQANEKYGSFLTIPIIAGGIAIEYRLDGASSVRLTPATLAKIFKGAIKKWDDPAITADNGSALPGKDIVVYVRSDRSGTSEVFTDYLSKAAGSDWTTGATGSFPTSGGQIGRAGSDGVSNSVQAQDGSIGYSELSFAVERNLAIVRVKNAAGQFKSPADAGAVAEAIDDATVNADGTLTLNYTTTNPAAYPISTVSYVLAATKMDAAKGENLKAFLGYALGDGQAKASALSYSPLPSRLAASGRAKVASINAQAATTTTTSAPATSTTTATTVATATTTATTAAPTAAPTVAASASRRSTAPTPAPAPAVRTSAAVAKTGGEHLLVLMTGVAMMGAGGILRLRRRRALA